MILNASQRPANIKEKKFSPFLLTASTDQLKKIIWKLTSCNRTRTIAIFNVLNFNFLCLVHDQSHKWIQLTLCGLLSGCINVLYHTHTFT